MTGPVLVTGGAGFIGCNLADRLASEGHDVLVFDSLARPGVEHNLRWLQQRHPRRIAARISDIRDESAVALSVAEASAVFHLAGQVAVTSSMADPRGDFDINLRGTFALLDALRRRGTVVPVVFASTNKVYGDLPDIRLERQGARYVPTDAALRTHGVAESRPLDFHTPYGCSKGAAEQYVLDFARSFGIPSVVMRMSCIYGSRQMGTEDQGWVAHFMARALRDEPIAVYGDGCQVRDVLHVDDAVAAYLGAWRRMAEISGRAFNLGGGAANAVSLHDVIARIGEIAGRRVATRQESWRPSDQRWYVSDTRAIRSALCLPDPVPWREGLADLADWLAVRVPQPAAALP